MSPEIWAAIISGGSAFAAAILSGIISYYRGRSTLRTELTNRLAEIGESGAEDRKTADRQYELEAMKAFRQAVGGPKGQIIEATHDLSDRLRRFLAREQDWSWTADSGYYRRSFTWLIIRPFVWMEILRRRMVHLDQTLGDLVEDEFRFLRYGRLMERALTEANLFRGTGYDPNIASAHLFAGTLRAAVEDLIRGEDPNAMCMSYRDFDEDKDGLGISRAKNVEEIVSNLGQPEEDAADSSREFRLARLVALYCAANSLLEHFALPYRNPETVRESIRRLRVISKGLQKPIRANLLRMLEDPTLRHEEDKKE